MKYTIFIFSLTAFQYRTRLRHRPTRPWPRAPRF